MPWGRKFGRKFRLPPEQVVTGLVGDLHGVAVEADTRGTVAHCIATDEYASSCGRVARPC